MSVCPQTAARSEAAMLADWERAVAPNVELSNELEHIRRVAYSGNFNRQLRLQKATAASCARLPPPSPDLRMNKQVYIAIRRASHRYSFETVIELCTFSDLVHSEIRVGSNSYAAYSGCNPCFLQGNAQVHPHPNWIVFRIPISDVAKACRFIDDIKDAHLPYRTPWECLVPQACLHEVETDLDCTQPCTWGKIFCSQGSLLFLRRCAMECLLPHIDVPRTHPLFTLDSDGVSPAQLYEILIDLGLTPLKTDEIY